MLSDSEAEGLTDGLSEGLRLSDATAPSAGAKLKTSQPHPPDVSRVYVLGFSDPVFTAL